MKKANYKILVFNNSKGSVREVSLSVGLFFVALSTLIFFNFLSLYYFADDYVSWSSAKEVQDHKSNNKALVSQLELANDKISNIEEKLATIVRHDNTMRDLLRMPRIHSDVRELGVGGKGLDQNESIKFLDYLLPDENEVNLQDYFSRLDFIERSTNLELLSYMEMSSNSVKKKSSLRHFPAIHPVDMSEAKLTSRFGYRRDPFSHKYRKHEGDDFSAKRGTDVMATADGLVVSSRYNGTFGNYIEISHGNGYKTVYGHLHKRNVSKGTYVVRGQKIGEVGNTGRSTAPHLHYEVKLNNKRVNPKDFYFDDI